MHHLLLPYLCGIWRTRPHPGLRQSGNEADSGRCLRRVCIITEKEEALRQFIINELHSGATIYEAIGAYNLQKHNEIITIVDKSEYQRLMTFINREDPKAFITVYNVSNMQYQPKIWKK